jgi:peptidoglycan-associated lipoprotein
MSHRRLIVSALAFAVVLGACSKEPPPPPEPTGPSQEELERMRADSVRAAQEAAHAAEEARRQREAEAARRQAVNDARAKLTEMVFFDFDESELTPATEATLREKVDILRASPQVQLRMEGHADERGSTEYNLALGSRRAEAVRDFFTSFGLDESRFTMVSYGEERPRVRETSEDAWAQNRRVEFVITAGANAIMPPSVGQQQ